MSEQVLTITLYFILKKDTQTIGYSALVLTIIRTASGFILFVPRYIVND